MTKKIIISILAVSGVVVTSAAREFVYHVGPFDKVSVRGNIEVAYRSNPDSVGMAVYDSDRDYSDALELTCNKGKLTIKEIKSESRGELPVICIYSDYLSAADYEGDETMTVDLSASTPTFSTRLTGNGRLVCNNVNSSEVKASIETGNGTLAIHGRCKDAKFNLTGTGTIQADNLRADNVKCNVLGTGSIGCDASETLDVRGLGTTKIYYKGDPTVKKVGGARIYRMTAETIEAAAGDNDSEPTVVEQ